MAEHVAALWVYQAKENIFTIAITGDGRFIFAGGDSSLYCFERSGNLIWHVTIEGIALSMALAEGSKHVLVGCSSGKAYIWSYQGHLLQMFETTGAIFGLSCTPTTYRIALGTMNGTLSLHDVSGHLLWQRSLPRDIRQLALSSDGNTLVLGCEDYYVYCFDAHGNQLWRFLTKGRVWAGATLSASASCVLAGSNDGYVYCFDRSGHLHWRSDIGTEINRIALTVDGRLAAAGGNEQVLWVWKQNGERLWKAKTPGEIYGLAISQDGRFVAAGTRRQAVVLFDEQGQLLWTQQMRDRVLAIALSPSGRLVGAVAGDHTISLVENQLASEDGEDWEAQRLIREIRRQADRNGHEGIALWFNSFDQALQARRLEVCELLMQELRAGGYQLLGEEEPRWVESREGMLWLYQGLRYQQQQQDVQARQAYERSQARQEKLKYLQGEGQVLMALETLGGAQGERDPNLLALLANPPEFLGNSEKFLERRLQTVLDVVQQYQLVLTSQQLGYRLPLLAAQLSPHAAIQAASASALHWLNPGLSVNATLDLLTSPHWIVRWQATLMLIQHAERNPQTLAAYHERVRQRINEVLLQEQDPTVLRNLAILLRSVGDAAQVPGLLPLLQDADLEVRLESVITLGKIGTRETLSSLRHVIDGRNAMKQPLSDWAAIARQTIRQRIPLAQVQQVICCPELTVPAPVQSTALFLTDNPEIHCIVKLVHITVGLRVKCTIKAANQEPMEFEEHISIRSLQHEKQADAQTSLHDWLYRLLAEEDAAFWSWREDEEEMDNASPATRAKEIVFSFSHPRRTWFPGSYSVEIALNDLVKYKQTFKVMSREAMRIAPYYYSKGLFFQQHKRYQQAFQDYEQALKFDKYHVDVLCSLGNIHTVRGRLKEAGEVYARAFQLDTNAVLAHLCMQGPLHLLELNNLQKIFTTLFQALMAIADPTTLSDTSVLLIQLGDALTAWLLDDRESATDILAQTMESSASSVGDHFARVAGLALLERQDESLVALEQLKSQPGNSLISTVLQASGQMLLGQRDEALSTLDRELYAAPHMLILHTAKASIQLRFQRYGEALAILEQALSIDPNSILLSAIKGFVLHQLGRDDEMLATGQHIMDFNPELLLALLLKAATLVLVQRYTEALALVDQVIAQAPDCIPAYGLAIYLQTRLDQGSQALTLCEQIIQRLPAFAFAYFIQGQLARSLGQTSAALSAFASARQLGLDTTALHMQEALTRQQLEGVQ